MLVLCSNGLSSEKLLKCVGDKIQGCKNAALVVTADNEYKEKNYHIKRCENELKAIHLSVDLFDLDQQSPESLQQYDIVEFIGGNPFYLLKSIRDNNFESVLKEIATHKVLIGWSAAAFVFGPTLELINIYSPDLNFVRLTDLTGLALTDIEVLPHYSRYCSKIEKFEERCSQYESKYGKTVFRLNDGDGIVIDEEAIICKS